MTHGTTRTPGASGKRSQDGGTLAEMQGITAEMGEAIARLAEEELEAGRVETARAMLEGLVVTNHRDADAWALLSGPPAAPPAPGGQVLRRGRRAARPGQSLGSPHAGGEPPGPAGPTRAEARSELAALAPDEHVGPRAQSLLAALGA